MSRCLVPLTVTSLVLSTTPAALAATPPAQKVRAPAVAGLFYPADPGALARSIDTYLAAAPKPPAPLPGRLRALICPHAGYVYSGPVAAAGFQLLPGSGFKTVLLLAPSHYAYLHSASVSAAEVFRTPLGDVPVSPRARQLAQLPPFALEPAVPVQRPAWAGQSSRPVPARGEEHADTWEHADEVEVPFLQKTLGDFALVPAVFGEVDPAAAARALAQVLDDETLVVVSSDLSHYHPYAEARTLDRRTIAAICALDGAALAPEAACGRTPILALLELARVRGWRVQLLDYRNSGDTAGDKSAVVGYAAIGFFEPAAAGFTPAERRQLLGLVRTTLREVTRTGRLPPPPAAPTAALAAPKGCFVTLTIGGALRGCIGNIAPELPLWQAVAENAFNAALRDPRFRPVAPEEVDRIEIEVSVLTAPEPLAFTSPDDLLRRLHAGKDGVVLRFADRSATYLPQVWEQIPDKAGFLDSLSAKAGHARGDWRKPGVAVFIYHVEAFQEAAD